MNSSRRCPEVLMEFFARPDTSKLILKYTIANLFFNVVLTLTASIGNALIIFAIWTSQNLQTPSYLLITSLSFTDLLVGLAFHPLQIVLMINILEYDYDARAIGDAKRICQFGPGYSFVITFLCVLSFLMVFFISIDRNLAFNLKHRYRFIVTKRRVRVVIVAGWMVAFPLAVSSTIFDADQSKAHVLSLLCFLSLLLAFTFVFYINIYISIKLYSTRIRNQPPNQPSVHFNVLKYKKTLKTMVIVLVCFLMCFVPFVCSLARIAFHGINYASLVFAFTSLTIMGLHSSVNPVIYLVSFRDIRRVSQRMLNNLLC